MIVFPHWGVEYRAKPTDGQRNLAHMAIDAGADMVIGNHPHWAEGMEVYKGKPIWYALGNLVFDQTWSEPTMEGITLEMTFTGKTLVQVRIRPHLILGKAQPNFMDPDGQRQGGHGPGLGRVEGAARLVVARGGAAGGRGGGGGARAAAPRRRRTRAQLRRRLTRRPGHPSADCSHPLAQPRDPGASGPLGGSIDAGVGPRTFHSDHRAAHPALAARR